MDAIKNPGGAGDARPGFPEFASQDFTDNSRLLARRAATNPNFQRVAQVALQSIDRVLSHWLPDGKRQGQEYLACNSTRPDNKPGSFSINLDSGKWADFATGDKGGDLISLVAYLDGGKQGEACRELAAFLGINAQTVVHPIKAAKERWTPIPVPDIAPPSPAAHSTLGRPAGQWTYHDESGRVLCHVYRFNLADGGKKFRPLTYCDNRQRQEWRWQGLSEPRPLYNLHLLVAHPAATVIVCEGEKAADAAATLFPLPEFVITTALNGAKSPGKTDWQPLAVRTVWLWPDADEAGRGFANEVCRLINKVQQGGTIRELRLDAFLQLPDSTARDSLPYKWDAANAVAEGFTAEHVKALMADPDNLIAPALEADPDNPERWEQEQFTLDSRGVWYHSADKKGEPLPPEWICSPLRVTARTRNTQNSNWGYLLEWKDPDHYPHTWAMAAELTSGSGEEPAFPGFGHMSGQARVWRRELSRGYRLEEGRKLENQWAHD